MVETPALLECAQEDGAAMTDQHSTNEPPLPGQGTTGCLGLLAGLAVLAAVSLVLTGVGYLVAHLFGWV